MNLKYWGFVMAFCLLVGSPTSAQLVDKHFLKEIGWTVTLPPGFKILSAADNAAINDKGKKSIEKTFDQKIDVSATQTLISAKKDQFHYFNCTITPFNVKKDGSWNETNASVKQIIYDTFKQQMSGVKMDSASVKATIDGQLFDKFTINLFIKDLHLTSILYCKLYKGFDMGITCMYVDEKVGKQLQTMLDNSKFTR